LAVQTADPIADTISSRPWKSTFVHITPWPTDKPGSMCSTLARDQPREQRFFECVLRMPENFDHSPSATGGEDAGCWSVPFKPRASSGARGLAVARSKGTWLGCLDENRDDPTTRTPEGHPGICSAYLGLYLRPRPATRLLRPRAPSRAGKPGAFFAVWLSWKLTKA
jgi:hypothetical protein